MNKKEWIDYIQKARSDYRQIGSVVCPGFAGEKIYFNKHGFNHLIRKMGRPRSIDQQIRRIRLIPYAIDILTSINDVKFEKTNMINDYSAEFWSLSKIINKIYVKVIVRQMKNGNKHFFSVMDKETR